MTENGKLIAKQKPERWLYVYDRLYENIPKTLKLSNAEILQRFGQRGLDLVNEVENHAPAAQSLISSNLRFPDFEQILSPNII